MATNNFFQRWSNRKLTKQEENSAVDDELTVEESQPEALSTTCNETLKAATSDHPHDGDPVTDDEYDTEPVLTHDDASAVTYDSGVASFMKASVDKSVKKAALRKLFHSDEFNYISDMDDCTEDFSNIPALEPAIAAQLRGWANKAVEKVTDMVDELATEPATDHTESKVEATDSSPSTLTDTTSLVSQDTHSATRQTKNDDPEVVIPTQITSHQKSSKES